MYIHIYMYICMHMYVCVRSWLCISIISPLEIKNFNYLMKVVSSPTSAMADIGCFFFVGNGLIPL